MEATKRKYLEERAKEIRRGALRAIGSVGSGHVGGSPFVGGSIGCTLL